MKTCDFLKKSILFSLVFILVSCKDQVPEIEKYQTVELSVGISTGTGLSSQSHSGMQKASLNDLIFYWDETDRFSLFDGTLINHNVSFSIDQIPSVGNAVFKGNVDFWDIGQSKVFYCAYPFRSTNTFDRTTKRMSFSLPVEQPQYYTADGDIVKNIQTEYTHMVAPPQTIVRESDNPNLSFSFSHITTLIDIIYVNAAGKNIKMTEISSSSDVFPIEGWVDMSLNDSDDKFAATTETKFTNKLTSFNYSASEGNVLFSRFVLFPFTIGESSDVSIKVYTVENNKAYVYTIKKTLAGSKSFLRGNRDFAEFDFLDTQAIKTELTYVQDGLLVWYDAKNNTGAGYSSTATSWKNLAPGATKYDGNINACTWGSDYLQTEGIISSYVRVSAATINDLQPAQPTIEVVHSYDEPKLYTLSSLADCESVSSCSEAGGINISNNSTITTYPIQQLYHGALVHNGTGYVRAMSSVPRMKDIIYHLVCRYNGNDVSFFENGAKYFTAMTGLIKYTTYPWILGADPGPTYANPSKIKIRSFRLYNRPLTDAEVDQNMIMDRVRFNVSPLGQFIYSTGSSIENFTNE
jgi:hypothetical protein